MIKKELSEIKKQFKIDNNSITHIAGCYVDNEKEKKATFSNNFLALAEEDMHKYLEIFKKALSGTIGKNLLNMDFPLTAEEAGGAQSFLLTLRKSELKDDSVLNIFYDRVIEKYYYSGNYLILLIHCAYDVPGKAQDNMEINDASEEVFSYVLCTICPVRLVEPGLCYNSENHSFENGVGDWVVDKPDIGFMFPSFNDRRSDIHSILYYSKNPEELHYDIASDLLGCELPLSAGSQKETFNELITETLGEDCEYDTVKNIHEKIATLIEENKDEPEPLVLDKTQLKNIFMDSGVSEERLENFDSTYEKTAGNNAELLAMNVANVKKFEVVTPDVVIKVNPERPDLVTTQIINGVRCLVIPLDDNVKVNGINVYAPVISDDVNNEYNDEVTKKTTEETTTENTVNPDADTN